MEFDNELIKKNITGNSKDISLENDADFDAIVSEIREKKENADKVIHDRYEGVLKNLNSKTDLPVYLPIPGRGRLLKRAILKLINFEVKPRNIAQNDANRALKDGVKATIGHNREQNIQIDRLQKEVNELNERIAILEKLLSDNINDTDEIRVFQFTSTLKRGDGVGNDILAIHKFLKNKNVKTRICYETSVGVFPKGDAVSISDMPALRESDILMVHVAFSWDFNEKLKELPGRKIFVYHNITPPEFFAPFDSVSEEACRLGLEQVKRIKNVPDYCLAVSEFNKKDLLSYGYESPIDVLPIIIPFEDYDLNPDEETMKELDDGMTNILFVGRISPNKKQEDIIRAFAYYQKNYNENSRLILLGGFGEDDIYFNSLAKYVKELGVKNVRFTTHIPFSQVVATFRSADAFVCLSEHEGFCIPLLEAMHFGIPIVAFDSTAVGDTLGNGGILLDKKDPVTVAAAIDMLIKDEDLRNNIRENQKKRLEDFTYEKITQRFWTYLTKFEPKLADK